MTVPGVVGRPAPVRAQSAQFRPMAPNRRSSAATAGLRRRRSAIRGRGRPPRPGRAAAVTSRQGAAEHRLRRQHPAATRSSRVPRSAVTTSLTHRSSTARSRSRPRAAITTASARHRPPANRHSATGQERPTGEHAAQGQRHPEAEAAPRSAIKRVSNRRDRSGGAGTSAAAARWTPTPAAEDPRRPRPGVR